MNWPHKHSSHKKRELVYMYSAFHLNLLTIVFTNSESLSSPTVNLKFLEDKI